MRFLRFRKRKLNADQAKKIAETHYLYEQELHKTSKLTNHLKKGWVAEEETRCWAKLRILLPNYEGDSFQDLHRAYEKGRYNDHPEKETIGRLSYYGRMIGGYVEEMAQTVQGDNLYQFFEQCRHSRLLAYHLFQLVDHLDNELTQCTEVGLEQYLLEKKPFDEASLQDHLQRLSLELGAIMVAEIQKTIALMQQSMNDPAFQFEPIAFEEEVGLAALQNKMARLQVLAGSLEPFSLKKQLIEKLRAKSG